jgi:hypothetical protein
VKRALFPLALACILSPAPSQAEEYRGHVRNLVVAPGQVFEEVHCLACSIRIEGKVESDLISILGGAEIQGEVHGDVIVLGGGLRIGPNAILKANVIVIGGPVERDPSAQVAGEVTSRWWVYLPGQRQVFLRGAAVFLGLAVGLALFGYALFRAQRTHAMLAAFRARPFATLLLGLILAILGFYGMDASEILGEFEDVADYLILMLGFLLALPGFAALSLWLGHWGGRTGAAAVMIGGALWALLMIVPLLGLLVFFLLFATCVGTAALARFGFVHQLTTRWQT